MTIATRLVNRSSIALGLAELYLAPSASHITQTTRVLVGTDYFGAKSEVSFGVTREFIKRMESIGDIKYMMDHLLARVDLEMNIKFIEIYDQTLSFALGGDGSETDFMEAAISKPAYLRAELVFTYPNKTNQMILIFPRCQIVVADLAVQFTSDDAISAPLKIIALQTSEPNWSTRPIGKSIFV